MEPVADEQRDKFRDWPAIGRWSVYAVIATVVITVLALIGGLIVVRQSLPTTRGRLSVSGLNTEVTVWRDKHGVPQIYATNPEDLFFAQGFVSAQDRFWQMDVRRHITAGRLSEMVGERGLATDKFARVMGWHRVAERELGLLAPATRQALESYAAGVNAWLHSQTPSTMSLEYTALSLAVGDYRPYDWSAVDSLAWLKALAWDLSGNVEDEMTRARLGLSLTAEQLAQLYPSYPYDEAPSVTNEEPPLPADSKKVLRRTQRTLWSAPHLAGAGDGVGSNAWAVTGSLTTSGKPLLANDPHLSVSLPGTFWQVGLHCATVTTACPYDVAGFSMAGFPGVIVGHNQSIAWGLTNVKADTVDLYLEKVEGHNARLGDVWEPMAERVETIKVSGSASVRIRVRETSHGPLLSDVSAPWASAGANAAVPSGSPERGNGYAVALNWTALKPGRTADGVLAIARAATWAQFRAAARQVEAPSLNLVYADVAGHIGSQVTGRIPVRAQGHSGDVPVAGWDLDLQPTEQVIPFDALPNSYDPTSGIIVAANQAAARSDYPYRLADHPDYGYRAKRINDLIRDQHAASTALRTTDMMKIQADTKNPVAPALVPHLLKIKLDTRYYRAGQKLLKDWDFNQGVDSAPAAYFNAVWRNLLVDTFDDQLPAAASPDGGSRWQYVVSQLLNRPDDRWWDNLETKDVIETRDDILRQALEEARDELVRRQSRDPHKWTWGHLHRLRLTSKVFGGNVVGRMLFGRQGTGAPGGVGAVNATAWDARYGYAVTTAPVMRMVVDMAHLNRSRWVNLAGSSGHAFSGKYVDQRSAWSRGVSPTWPWTSEAIEANAEDTLVLAPGD